jgi:hypothetical protein
VKKLNYANVMATVAVFLALGGGAFAAVKLGKNSVKTKSIKNGAVTENKLASNAVTEAKVKKFTYTDASGFTNGWATASAIPKAQFGKDALGVVHLRGNIINGADNVAAFTLPSGSRPAFDMSTATTSGFSTECTIGVEANGEVTPTGCNNLFVSLDTITFSAGG